MSTAYFLCRFQAPEGNRFPVIDRFCLSSQPATSMADCGFYAEILQMDGKDYQGARDNLIACFRENPHWAWALSWVE